MKTIDTYNMIVGAIVAALTAIFGVYWYLFAAYLLFNVLDWLTGWYKSRKLKQESSSVGLLGILKKLGYWDKSDRIVLSHGWKYNIDRFVCE